MENILDRKPFAAGSILAEAIDRGQTLQQSKTGSTAKENFLLKFL